jgi:DNA-binding GntR family transcriptional regulator
MTRKASRDAAAPQSDEVRRQTRAYQAYLEIRRRIVHHEMPPGEPFSESELAADLGLSKTPVREALLLLGHEGLVHTRASAGYRVAPLTLKDVRQICAHRKLLEVAAIEQAAAIGLDGRNTMFLTDVIDPTFQPDPHGGFQVSRNHTFHYLLSQVVQDLHLVTDLSRVLTKLEWVTHLAFGASPPDTPEEHRELLRAVLEGDPKTAGAQAAAHADAAEAAIVDALLAGDAVGRMTLS